MNDKELLELAAKSAGLRVVSYDDFLGCMRIASDGSVTGYGWNPLTDDGDALRLAVKLGLDIVQRASLCDGPLEAVVWVYQGSCFIEPYTDDPCAATRRAIVRAAAQIGAGK